MSADLTPRTIPTWRVVLQVIGYRPWLYASKAVVEVLTFSVAPWLSGLVLKAYFDRLSGQASAGLNAWTLAALFVGIALGQAVTSLGDIVMSTTLGRTMQALLGRNMLEGVLEKPGARALPESTGEALSRFRDDTAEVGNFAYMLLAVPASLVFLPVALATMLRISVLVTLVSVVPLFAIFGVARLASRRIGGYREATRVAESRAQGFVGEVFGTAQAIKVAGAEDRVIGHLDELYERWRAVRQREALFEHVLEAMSFNLGSFATGVTVLVAASAIRSGSFTVGDLALFTTYLGSIAGFVTIVEQVVASYRQAEVSVERMRHLM